MIDAPISSQGGPPSDASVSTPDASPGIQEGEAPEAEVPSFGKELATFVQRIEAFARTLPLMMAVMQLTEREAGKRCNTFLNSYGMVKEKSAEGLRSYILPPERQEEYDRLKRRLTTARHGRSELPRSYLISLVSHFDSYVGRLIRTLFLVKPELLNASERNISLQQLTALGSIEEARELVIEKEVESVLRESHSEHFRWLENKLAVTLRKDLPVWPAFVEVTERRNLFVHTGGQVSNQYLKVCHEHGVGFEPPLFKSVPRLGEELEASPQYFMHAYRVVFEVGFKLAHVLWRKLQPEEREDADQNLVEITYDVLFEKDYELAMTLLDFGTGTIKTFSSEDARRRLVINRAQAYKWSGDAAEARRIVDAEDWSASGEAFRLAVAVLSDDFAEAAEIMRGIGVSKQPTKVDYQTWPLFREFRESAEFATTFNEVFGEEYVRNVTKEADVDLLDIKA